MAIDGLGGKCAARRQRARKQRHAEPTAGERAIGVGGFHQVTPLNSASNCVAVDEL